jgi:hypothetical protein
VDKAADTAPLLAAPLPTPIYMHMYLHTSICKQRAYIWYAPNVLVWAPGLVAERAADLVEHIEALRHLSKHGMFPIQVGEPVRQRDKEARVIQVRAKVGHRHGAPERMLELGTDLVTKVPRLLPRQQPGPYILGQREGNGTGRDRGARREHSPRHTQTHAHRHLHTDRHTERERHTHTHSCTQTEVAQAAVPACF